MIKFGLAIENFTVITKPFDTDHLLLLISRALEKQRLLTDTKNIISTILKEGLSEITAAAVQSAECRAIKSALEFTQGNKTKAAEILKVRYKTLLTKIKDYGIE